MLSGIQVHSRMLEPLWQSLRLCAPTFNNLCQTNYLQMLVQLEHSLRSIYPTRMCQKSSVIDLKARDCKRLTDLMIWSFTPLITTMYSLRMISSREERRSSRAYSHGKWRQQNKMPTMASIPLQHQSGKTRIKRSHCNGRMKRSKQTSTLKR